MNFSGHAEGRPTTRGQPGIGSTLAAAALLLFLDGSQHPARYALEVRQGWFKNHGVAVGTEFELQPE